MPVNISIRRAAAVTAFVMGAGAAAHSQQAKPGPRWLGLLGCWSIAETGSAPDAQHDNRIVCVTPTADANVAEISAIANGKVLTKDRVDASGRSYPLQATGCVGTQHANWSADQRRVFLQSSITCDGVTTNMSALLALTLTGQWIDIRRVWSGRPDSGEVHVARYRDAGLPRSVPADIATRLRGYAMSIETGRIAASVPVNAGAIIEASRLVDSTIVAAWLMESGQRFALDSREWQELADAGVPAQVRDAMDDTVHPIGRNDGRHFEEYGRWSRQASASWDQGTGVRRIFGTRPLFDPLLDPWGFGVGSAVWPYALHYGYIDPFGFGLAFGNALGFDNALGYVFGYRRSATGYQRPNVLVLKDAAAAAGRDIMGQTPPSEPKGEENGPRKSQGTILVGGVPVSTNGGTPASPTPSPRSGGGAAKP